MMIIGHPGSWQQFQLRLDNKGLSIMEMKSKYLHEQYLFESQMLNLQQLHQQNAFMNGAGGGGPLPSSTPTPPPVIDFGTTISFFAASISEINTDLGWDITNIENWKSNAFDTISGEITGLTITNTGFGSFNVVIGGLSGLNVSTRVSAFENSTTLGSIDDSINGGIINSLAPSTFAGSSISTFVSSKCQQAGTNAFRNSSLGLVTLGDGTSNINLPEGLFMGCSSLTGINLNFTDIILDSPYTFADCTSMTGFTFENLIRDMSGGYAFAGCSSVTSLNIGGGAFNGSIGPYSFEGCTSLNIFTLSNSDVNPLNQAIDEFAFKDCSSLANLTIQNLVLLNNTNLFEGTFASNGNATFYTGQNGITYDPYNQVGFLTGTKGWNVTYAG